METERGHLVVFGGKHFVRTALAIQERMALSLVKRPIRLTFIGAASGSRQYATSLTEHYQNLGAEVALDSGIYSRDDADDEQRVGQVLRSNVIYLGAGSGQQLLEVLSGTRAARAIRHAYLQGAMIMGMSAGAAALGSIAIDARPTVIAYPALGLLDETIIQPHYDEYGRAAALLGVLGSRPHVLGLGIDERTMCIIRSGRSLTVLGEGSARLVRASGELQRINAGQTGKLR